jgi:[amino group carrier protein]-lysine/ornithine hydrolase
MINMPGIPKIESNCLETLLELVSIYSPSGDENRAGDYLVDRMNKLGFTQAYKDKAGNAVGLIGEGPRQLVMLGHIDTVPGMIPVRIDGDLLYGRGSVDAKGALAAFVETAALVGVREGWQIVVIGAVDEERNSTGARACLDQFSPKYAVIGEPSRWSRITLGYKGSAATRLKVCRDLVHNAAGMESACEAAFHIWGDIMSWTKGINSGRERQFDRVSPSLRGIDSGSNGFEEWASLELDVRLPPEMAPEEWYGGLLNRHPGIIVEKKGFPVPAYQARKNNILVREFLRVIRSYGGEPGFVLKTGTSDMNVVGTAWNCPILAYGPGDSALDHTPNENISLTEYRLAIRIIEQVVRAVCSISL